MNYLFGFVYKSIYNGLNVDAEDLVYGFCQFEYDLTCLSFNATLWIC